MSVELAANVKAADGKFNDATNVPLRYTDGYTVTNAYARLVSETGAWNLSLWARNATEEIYYEHAFAVLGLATVIPAEPRTYGITFGYNL